jgi:hypothetical protein
VQLFLAEPSPRGLPRGLPVLAVPIHEPIRVPLPPVSGLPKALPQVSPGHPRPRLFLLNNDLPHTLRVIRRLWGLTPRTQTNERDDTRSSLRWE